MGEIFTVRTPESPDVRYAPDAYQDQLGEAVPVRLPDGRTAEGILRAVFVPDGGAYVDLTVEVPDETLPPSGLKRYSIGR